MGLARQTSGRRLKALKLKGAWRTNRPQPQPQSCRRLSLIGATLVTGPSLAGVSVALVAPTIETLGQTVDKLIQSHLRPKISCATPILVHMADGWGHGKTQPIATKDS